MKHIGILAHSAEGSSLCYREICHGGSRELGDHMHPEVTMSVLPMGASMADWEQRRYEQVRSRLFQSATRLKDAGCDFFVCPDNTAHLALEAKGLALPLPGLHIAETVVSEAQARGYAKLGVLGTKWTMSGGIYFEAARRMHLEIIAPDAADQGFVNETIFSELCNGVMRKETRDRYVDIISSLQAEGCSAVILGCTEIPLLVAPHQSPLPCLDSTRILARSALDVAFARRPLPTWVGGA